jgi:hypothetical protein
MHLVAKNVGPDGDRLSLRKHKTLMALLESAARQWANPSAVTVPTRDPARWRSA